MNVPVITRWALGVGALMWLTLPRPVEACAACFGRSDSPMAQGMNMGILALLCVIVSVLIGFAVFFIFLARRAARLSGWDTPAALSDPQSQPVSPSTR